MLNQELFKTAKKQLGHMLRETRAKMGSSIAQMAFKTGLTIDELERIESGELVSIEYFLLYCQALDCNIWLAIQPLKSENNTNSLLNFIHRN